MEHLRTVGCLGKPEKKDTEAPFSNFKFVEDTFGLQDSGCRHLKRILSQARTLEYKTIVIEKINSVGFSKDDDKDLQEAGYELSDKKLVRLTFFNKAINSMEDIVGLHDDNFIGYAILKHSPRIEGGFQWIVFESIIKSSRYINNYYHAKKDYKVRCFSKMFLVNGNICCQQNGITNVCAHASIRVCLSMLEQYDDFSYRTMNSILKKSGCPHFVGEGLLPRQIVRIFEGLNINHRIASERLSSVPFQKYLYGSIESGYPALLGFSFGDVKEELDNEEDIEGHIIPIIGHTFNEDTWVPNADTSYFSVGGTRYVPSESWVSSYICNDDNFGSHYCLPRKYLTKKNDPFVVEILPPKAKYDATDAQLIAIDHLYSLAMNINVEERNKWLQRLVNAIENENGWVVLRPIFLTGTKYLDHLKSLKVWDSSEAVNPKILSALDGMAKGSYWVIEVSLPELFPANRAKLGEVVLNADVDKSPPGLQVEFARLPGFLYVMQSNKKSGTMVATYPTGVNTHSQIYLCDQDGE